jgi:hypothetical protein
MPQLMTDGARSIAANTKVDNILAGKVGEFVTRPSIVRVRAAAAAAGMRITILGAGVNVVDDQEISQANRWPILPDDLVTEFALTGPTDRLVISLRNTTAGAIVVNTVVEVIDA